MKAWIKGGLIGGIIFFIYSLLDLEGLFFLPIIHLPIHLFPIFPLVSLNPLGVIISFLVNVLIYSLIGFILGSLIGWVYSQFKEHKK